MANCEMCGTEIEKDKGFWIDDMVVCQRCHEEEEFKHGERDEETFI